MFNRYQWTELSLRRNRFTQKYEPLQPYLFCAFAEAIGAEEMIDVGANVGQYSILSRGVVGLRHAHAFEAERDAYDQLVENLALNQLEGEVTAHLLAVSEAPGTVSFAVSAPLAGNNGIAATSIHRPSKFKEQRTVEADTLDHRVPARDSRLAIKIDVEGHELQVLRGARDLLTRNTAFLQIELYNDEGTIAAFLADIGYRKLMNAGPDTYFSNAPALAGDAQVLAMCEKAIAAQIDYNLKG